MAKSYVPEGTFTACDKGSSPNQLRVSNHASTTIYNQPMATEADLLPFFNIKPMGLCSSPLKWTTGVSCMPTVIKWENPKDGVKINGKRMLILEDSYCKCLYGGKIQLFEARAAAVAYGMGTGKMPSEYIKEGFDWAFKQMEEGRDARDKLLPDWMQPVTHTLDWYQDYTVSLAEGAVNGIVGMGEVIYQVAQDPVGMGEAIGSMASDAWDATSDGVTNAYNWASEADNWEKATDGAWDWASDGDNWIQAAKDTGSGIADAAEWVSNNPRAIGNTIGEFIPDAVAAAYTAGGSLAATGAKKAGREIGEEIVEEVVEKSVKEGVEELGEAGGKKARKEIAEEVAAHAVKKGPPGQVVTRSADEIAEAISKKQKQIIDDIESGKIKLEGYEGHRVGNHTRKSNYGEMKMDEFMREQGYEPLHTPIDNIDQPIKQGIDGVYRHPGPPPKYVIGEAKYNTSTLSQGAKDGPQMSDDWIEGSRRLERAVSDIDLADEILLNGYDKVVVHTDELGNVTANTVQTIINDSGNPVTQLGSSW